MEYDGSSQETPLTDEPKERIRLNRERALEIQRRRKREADTAVQTEVQESTAKRRKVTPRKNKTEDDAGADEAEVELEDFEVDASPWVSKKDATKMYCLPEGTLAVCSYQEKQNPRHKGWTPMKLYSRSDIRRRARERYGGLQGLIDERKRREDKKFRKDFDKAKEIFS